MGKPSAKDQLKLDRLRARGDRLLERGQAVEGLSRRLYGQAEEAFHELAELERTLGLRLPAGPPADLATVASIFKKTYAARPA